LRLVQGVGINDANYKIRAVVSGLNVWKCPFYSKWENMLQRCYSEKFHNRIPTYRGCSVCKEWLLFSNFKAWMEQQDWKGKQLDKDLLVYQNKIYSPETCCFVSSEVNTFLTKRLNDRGDYPLGVVMYNGKYKSRVVFKTQQINLGYYYQPLSVHREWQKAKIKYTKILQQEQTDLRVISGLQRVIDKIQNDYDNNLETIDF